MLFLCGTFYVHTTFAQNNTLSLTEITTALQSTSGNYTKEERLSFVAEQVKVRGVDFLFTPTNENALKEAGATSELLEAIREESTRTTASADDIRKANDFYNTGNSFLGGGSYDQAIENFQNAIILNPRHGYAYGGLGQAYYGKKEFEKSIEFYSKAIAARPDPILYSNRAVSYYAARSFDKAIRDYTQVIEKQPESTKAYLSRGQAYFSNNDYDKAIVDYEKALELEPNNNDAQKKLSLTIKWKEIQEKRKQKNNDSPE